MAQKHDVLVVDSQPLSRRGILSLLKNHPSLRVCAEGGSAREARALCEKHSPALAVVDLELSDGFSLLKELPRWAAGIRLIALTMQEDTAAVQRALRAGASGYVTRRDSQDELLKALQAALAGQRYVGLRVADCLLNTLVDGRLSVPNNGLERLTDREMETFCGLGQGKKVRTLAEEMGISAKTVEAHQARIRTKLEIADGAELRRQAALFMEASKAGAPKRRGGAAGKTARGRG